MTSLLAVLDPDIVFEADEQTVKLGASHEIRGAERVGEFLFRRARGARAALIDGAIGLLGFVDERLLIALRLQFARGGISAISAVADPLRLASLSYTLLADAESS